MPPTASSRPAGGRRKRVTIARRGAATGNADSLVLLTAEDLRTLARQIRPRRQPTRAGKVRATRENPGGRSPGEAAQAAAMNGRTMVDLLRQILALLQANLGRVDPPVFR